MGKGLSELQQRIVKLAAEPGCTNSTILEQCFEQRNNAATASLSRALKRLKDRGLITVNGKQISLTGTAPQVTVKKVTVKTDELTDLIGEIQEPVTADTTDKEIAQRVGITPTQLMRANKLMDDRIVEKERHELNMRALPGNTGMLKSQAWIYADRAMKSLIDGKGADWELDAVQEVGEYCQKRMAKITKKVTVKRVTVKSVNRD